MAIDEMSTTTLAQGSVAELAESLRGELIRPGDPEYDDARTIWNGAHDHKMPALIVRAAGVSDVIRAVEFARSEELLVSVRGGAHSIPGFSTNDGGIVIDLSQMKGIRVDPESRTAVAQPGLTWAEFDHETQQFGLAVTGGLVSSTGISGFTLGGGVGWLMRKHGLTADNLRAADLVTADGRLVHCSADENPELYWGIRGGGGNFGIAVSLEYDLHQVGPIVTAGAVFYPGALAGDILRFYREFCEDAPDELTTLVSLATAPPAPFLPEEVHGHKGVVIAGMYAGSPEDGEKAFRPLRELGPKAADLIGPMPYVAMQGILDPLWGPGSYNYFKAGWMGALDDDSIDTLVHYHENISSPKSEIHVHHVGGAVARVPADATAFGDRSAPYLLNTIGSTFTSEGYDEAVQWARDLHGAIEPGLTGGTYVNFLTDQGEDGVRSAYGDKFERLQALKDEYDPTNLFRLNQNIPPSRRA